MQSALEAQRTSLVNDCAMDWKKKRRARFCLPGPELADLVLLIVLLVASFANNEELVQIFGLTHGIVFLALIAIVGIGAVQKLWSWWFLVATLVTTGPPRYFAG